ncbi:hypothetical protein PHMEG_0006371 [Phytophthora megakarya]|uniref:Bzip transcription factor n=1 Tax=Phytophthora megakarya TaxID=4795 RepID=A0A225WP69_9STRA|nr:hypothetical protein PHMEG_0006371 [Phytophthora megakarya]
MMAPDVTDGSICGPKAILESWELLSIVFDDMHVQLERLKTVDKNSLAATTTTSFTLKPDTIRLVFPLLVDSGTGGGDEDLAKKLQDQRIVMHGSVRFDWDDTNNCIWRMNSQSDMLTPILGLLENLEDVSRAFINALVAPDFRLVL